MELLGRTRDKNDIKAYTCSTVRRSKPIKNMLRTKQCQQVRDAESTNRDHEDNAYNISLISRLRVVQEMPIDVEYCKSNGSNSAQKRHNVEIKRNRIRHFCKQDNKTRISLSTNYVIKQKERFWVTNLRRI